MANGEQTATQHWLDPTVPDQLRDELASAQAKRLDLEAKRDAMNADLTSLRAHIRKLQDLLGEDQLETEDYERQFEQPTERDQAHAPTHLDERTERILNLAESVLKQRRPRDMHYSDIADAVSAKGGNLPQHTKSRHDTLIRMMNEDPKARFIRPHRRGFYALSEDYPDSENVGTRRARPSD